jgi:hypothetical protein
MLSTVLNNWMSPVAALLSVLGLFLLLANLAARWRPGGAWRGRAGTAAAGTGAGPLVLRSCPVDSRRRLVLVGCDGGVALLMLGGPNGLVVPLSVPASAVAAPLAALTEEALR